MARYTAALKFLKKSKEYPVRWLERKMEALPLELQKELPAPWSGIAATRDPKGAKEAWLRDAGDAEKKIRRALGESARRHSRSCVNKHTATREKARRLGQTGQIFRELLGSKRANGKEILTIGEGKDKQYLYTADTVHRALSGHFDKHFGAGRKKWYRREQVHPLFRMDTTGKAYREKVLNGTADPTNLPSDLRGSLRALQTKTIGGSNSPLISTPESSLRRPGR